MGRRAIRHQFDQDGGNCRLLLLMCTLFVLWMGLLGGLGGGIGTIHEQEGCREVMLTLPVILYPITEMLEIWLDKRAHEKRRKLEMQAASVNLL
jgi:hypothetical protein